MICTKPINCQKRLTINLLKCLFILLFLNVGCAKKRTLKIQEQLDQNLPLEEIINGAPRQRLFGKYYQGGLIFYISKVSANQRFCLIATQKEIATDVIWADYDTNMPGIGLSGFGDGAKNTESILNECSVPGIAADLCDKLELNGYSDWYLPTLAELSRINTLFQHENNYPFQYEQGSYFWASNRKNDTDDGKALTYQFSTYFPGTHDYQFEFKHSVLAVRKVSY